MKQFLSFLVKFHTLFSSNQFKFDLRKTHRVTTDGAFILELFELISTTIVQFICRIRVRLYVYCVY